MPPADAVLAPVPAAGAGIRPRLTNLLRATVLGATVGTLVLNGSQTLLGSASTVVATNVLGTRGYGAYSFAFTWATLLTIPSVLGMTPLVVRHVAAYRERAAWGHLRGLVRRTNQAVGLASILLATVAAGAGWLAMGAGSDLLTPFLVGLLLVPLISLVTMRQATMAGLGQVVLGRLPDTVVAPLLLLAGLLAITLVTGGHYSATAAIGVQVVAAAAALVLGVWLLRRVLPSRTRVDAPRYETGVWIRGGLVLLAASIAIALEGQLGTVVLGVLRGSRATGVFAASIRVATFASFLYAATSYPIMPALARLYAGGAVGEAGLLAVRAARAVTLLSLPLVGLVFGLAPTLLGILGSGFAAGATTLRILLIGELIRQATGYGGTVLLMAGHESAFARIAVGVTAVNVAACLVLVPMLGVEGAALATMSAVVLQNVAMLVAAWRRTGVWTAALPLPRRLRPGAARSTGAC